VLIGRTQKAIARGAEAEPSSFMPSLSSIVPPAYLKAAGYETAAAARGAGEAADPFRRSSSAQPPQQQTQQQQQRSQLQIALVHKGSLLLIPKVSPAAHPKNH